MNELKIFENNDTQMVSAREVYKELEVKTRFSAWFEINSKLFVEGEDFVSVHTCTVDTSTGVQRVLTLQDYQMTVDMAKHLCLMSKTEKGKQVRQYLIDLEKAWNTPEQVFARALRLADQTIEKLKVDMQHLSVKAQYTEEVLESTSLHTVTQIAKDYDMSAKAFNSLLNQIGLQYKVSGQWVLYAKFHDYGYTKSVTNTFTRPDGTTGSAIQTKWTEKGRLFIYEELKDRGILPVKEESIC